MAAGDGNGWVTCDQGHQHWGVYGAAGLFGCYRGPEGDAHVLLQHRATWSHHGGTWGLLGGARDSHESADQAALREASEEADLDVTAFRLAGLLRDDHGGWAYDTLVAAADGPLPVRPATRESQDVVWVPLEAAGELTLHPGLRQTWPRVVQAALARLVIVVDAANVVGARPDGWWRDRVGATTRIRRELAYLARVGVPASALPTGATQLVDHWFPLVRLVVEGAARDIPPGDPEVVVTRAPASGDDAVVEVVRDHAPTDVVVAVTADRELRERCRAAGATVAGPGWLLDLLPTSGAGG